MEKDHDRDGLRRGGGMGRESSKLCKAVLDDLITLDGDGWFLDPVDPVEMEIPDYVEVVKEPMDLGTVRVGFGGAPCPCNLGFHGFPS
jgi:bromodomain-containing factor 1